VARYQQYRAVNRVIEQLRTGTTRKDKSGVVWHTQGSGKSLTMVMLAMKMRRDPELQQYKLVFVTDRAQLDSQLSTTFRDAQDETVYNADSIERLKRNFWGVTLVGHRHGNGAEIPGRRSRGRLHQPEPKREGGGACR